LSKKREYHKIEYKTLRKWFLGFRDVTNITNERTSIFSIIPYNAVGHTLPLVIFSKQTGSWLLLGSFNSLVFDFVARQKIGGMHLTYGYLKQLPALFLNQYLNESVDTIRRKIMELVFTSWDTKTFADDIWKEADDELRAAIRYLWEENKAATGGHPWTPPEWSEEYGHTPDDTEGCPLPPFKWDEDRRAILKAELDAIYAKLYGLNRKQLRYILDPADLTPRELENILDPWEEIDNPLDPDGYAQRSAQSTFPGETFRVLKEKEFRQYNEYRTRRLVLEAWERILTINP
jgi:hypothetical protein